MTRRGRWRRVNQEWTVFVFATGSPDFDRAGAQLLGQDVLCGETELKLVVAGRPRHLWRVDVSETDFLGAAPIRGDARQSDGVAVEDKDAAAIHRLGGGRRHTSKQDDDCDQEGAGRSHQPGAVPP